MTDKPFDDVLQELRAELDVEPSPEFAAKVRTRIAETASVSPFGRWAAWGAIAAVAGLLAVVAVRQTTSQLPALPSAPTTARVVAPDRPVVVPAPVVPPPAAVTRRPVRRAASPIAAQPQETTRATSPVVLEVVTNQPALIRQAFQQARGKDIGPPPVVPPVTEELWIGRVVIEPIVIPGSGETPPPAGVSPVIRRVSARDATRSPE
jgi:hypothetical protein